MAAPAVLYCSIDDVKAFMSEQGVFSRVDDDEDGIIDSEEQYEDAAITNAVNIGTEEVNKYIERRYLPAKLANSELVKYFATMFAAAYLCRRRGNGVPESMAEELDLIISQLEDIRDGRLDVPGVPERASRGPHIVNVGVDPRFARPIRRQDYQSSPRRKKSNTGPDYRDQFIYDPY